MWKEGIAIVTLTVPPTGPLMLRALLQMRWPGMAPGALNRALRQRDVLVNGRRVSRDMALLPGDEIRLYIDDALLQTIQLRVLHRDPQLLAIEKPRGIAVTDMPGAETLTDRVHMAYPNEWPAIACHRLDVMTGGIVLFARTPQSHEALLRAFRTGEIEKRYAALILGSPEPSEGTLRHYLIKDAARATVTALDSARPGARRASCAYRVIDQPHDGLSRVHIQLHTGRTHQLRVQFAHIGHPILGDDRYGDRTWNRVLKVRHQALWACGLTLRFCKGPLQSLDGLSIVSNGELATIAGQRIDCDM